MTSTRPYREPVSVGGTLSEIVRLSPQKYDPNVVQALLIQVRRDAVGSSRIPLLDDRMRSKHRACRHRSAGGQPAAQNEPQPPLPDAPNFVTIR